MAVRRNRAAVGSARARAARAVAADLLSRTLEHRLFGVTPLDPMVWFAAVAILVATALLAAWIPVRRAARVEVTEALRV